MANVPAYEVMSVCCGRAMRLTLPNSATPAGVHFGLLAGEYKARCPECETLWRVDVQHFEIEEEARDGE